MFRIRRVYDDITPANHDAIKQVQNILRTQFPGISSRDINKLPEQFKNPLKYSFRSILFVAEGIKGRLDGFAILSHEPILHFCYLDYISAAQNRTGGGIGGALYERVREEALDLEAMGIYFECLPDDSTISKDPAILKQNKSRLRFYEKYGARPIINSAYETPLTPGGDNPPYLVYDNLGMDIPIPRDTAREIVRAILERKYKGVCPPEYIQMVVDSFKDDPVRLRPPRYFKKPPVPVSRSIREDRRIRLVVNDRHHIHHVEERGYVESPVRINAILDEINQTSLFRRVTPRHYSENHIREVHALEFVEYLKNVCLKLEDSDAVYPYVFPIRNRTKPPKDLPLRAGYYCIDTFTPLTGNAYLAAKRGVDCAITAARELLEGYRLAYALIRPPGHHAESATYGGFCYFNSAAVAANLLSKYGKVAMLDIDYHHGNGQQEIFYDRADVLTVSLHGHPSIAYPYYTGFAGEKGIGEGKGFNINLPLPEILDGENYRKTLKEAIKKMSRFHPRYLVVPFGLDTAKEDPTGSWMLEAADFEAVGKMIGTMHLPSLIIQEGGYDTRVLGVNARAFFTGLWAGTYQKP